MTDAPPDWRPAIDLSWPVARLFEAVRPMRGRWLNLLPGPDGSLVRAVGPRVRDVDWTQPEDITTFALNYEGPPFDMAIAAPIHTGRPLDIFGRRGWGRPEMRYRQGEVDNAIQLTLEYLAERVIVLLPLYFLTTTGRYPWLSANLPERIFILPDQIDRLSCAWMSWQAGRRRSSRLKMLALTPSSERQGHVNE